MKDRLTTAPLPLERAKRYWNGLRPLGTARRGLVKTTITHALHTESWR